MRREDDNGIEFKRTVSFIEQELNARPFPGAALAVMQGDRLLLERYWGRYCSRTLRPLAERPSEIARLGIQQQRIERYRKTNAMEAVSENGGIYDQATETVTIARFRGKAVVTLVF